MKGDFLYWSVARALDWFVWGGEILNPEDLPHEHPVVFIANHAAALGPIAVAASLPVRVYSWVVGDMLDWDKAADYLCRDFVEPQLHVPRSISRLVSKILAQFSVRLLRGIECVAVRQGEALHETYRTSIDYLLRNRDLLIFPEDPAGPMDERSRMTPFKKGFARLGEMYYEKTKNILQFYPLSVHTRERVIKVGAPVSFNPLADPFHERSRIKHALESSIHETYLALEHEIRLAIPLPD